MLNQDTKRKIDSARQILVGKVPDPKAQVEQITTALIYKFMDDTDKEAQVLGGKARYFTNGYEKYAWSKIMDVRLGGHDRLNLYFEAVSNLGRPPASSQRNALATGWRGARAPSCEVRPLWHREASGASETSAERWMRAPALAREHGAAAPPSPKGCPGGARGRSSAMLGFFFGAAQSVPARCASISSLGVIQPRHLRGRSLRKVSIRRRSSPPSAANDASFG